MTVIKLFSQVIVFAWYFLASLFVPLAAPKQARAPLIPFAPVQALSNRLQGTAILGREDRCFGAALPAIDARPIRRRRVLAGIQAIVLMDCFQKYPQASGKMRGTLLICADSRLPWRANQRPSPGSDQPLECAGPLIFRPKMSSGGEAATRSSTQKMADRFKRPRAPESMCTKAFALPDIWLAA